MTRVFVSYARWDFPFVRDLLRALNAAGCETWLDLRDIPPGGHWHSEIDNAIDGCTHVIVVVSKYSLESKEVLREINIAMATSKATIPMLIHGSRLPQHMVGMQWIDCRIDFDMAIQSLLRHIRKERCASSVPTLPRREIRFMGIPVLAYYPCPTAVRFVAVVLIFCGAFEVYFAIIGVMDRCDSLTLVVAVLNAINVFCIWRSFCAVNRRSNLLDAALVPVLMAMLALIAMRAAQVVDPPLQVSWFVHLVIAVLEVVALSTVLLSRSYRRWMVAYPSGWGRVFK